MRKLVITMLLASAASPVLAGPREHQRDETRAERQQAREERQQAREQHEDSNASASPQSNASASEGRSRPERPQRNSDNFSRWQAPTMGGIQPTQQIQQAPAHMRRDRPVIDRQVAAPGPAEHQQMFQQRHEQRDARLEAMRQARIERQQELRNARPPIISKIPQPGTQPPPPVAARPTSVPAYHWSSSNWRHDKRYDWHKHRNKFWWLFQLGSYYDPFGWGYYPYQIGWRMWPNYYSDNYWINDPWHYRLPYAPPGTRWVRYWDDAVLVDTWSGQVVDVIYNFFW